MRFTSTQAVGRPVACNVLVPIDLCGTRDYLRAGKFRSGQTDDCLRHSNLTATTEVSAGRPP